MLAQYGVPVTRESVVHGEDDAAAAALDIGYPVALKGCGEAISHKTEMDLIALNLTDEREVRAAFNGLMARSAVEPEGVLVQQMIKGDRELMAGRNNFV